MADRVQLYEWSLRDAVEYGEKDLWLESHRENCACAAEIEKAMQENYRDNIMHSDCLIPIIEKYGFNRVNRVLANSLQTHLGDGRISDQNHEWAKSIYVPRDDARWQYAVRAHPGLLDIMATRAQKEYANLKLFDHTHCVNEPWKEDYTDKVLVLRGSVLKDEYKSPDYQLFLAESGFGCKPDAMGTKVFGQFLKDGEQTRFTRQDFCGPIKEEFLPDWAKEKLQQIRAEEAPTTTQGPIMGGM